MNGKHVGFAGLLPAGLLMAGLLAVAGPAAAQDEMPAVPSTVTDAPPPAAAPRAPARAPARGGKPTAAPNAPADAAAQPAIGAGPAAAASSGASGGTALVGDRDESPYGLYFIPWREAKAEKDIDRPARLLQEKPVPIDRVVFNRQVEYYEVLAAELKKKGVVTPETR